MTIQRNPEPSGNSDFESGVDAASAAASGPAGLVVGGDAAPSAGQMQAAALADLIHRLNAGQEGDVESVLAGLKSQHGVGAGEIIGALSGLLGAAGKDRQAQADAGDLSPVLKAIIQALGLPPAAANQLAALLEQLKGGRTASKRAGSSAKRSPSRKSSTARPKASGGARSRTAPKSGSRRADTDAADRDRAPSGFEAGEGPQKRTARKPAARRTPRQPTEPAARPRKPAKARQDESEPSRPRKTNRPGTAGRSQQPKPSSRNKGGSTRKQGSAGQPRRRTSSSS